MSPPLAPPKNRLGLPSEEMDRFTAALDRTVGTYQWAKQWEAKHRTEGAPAVFQELDAFHRSLGRTATLRSAAKHWSKLSEEGRTFVEMRLRMAEPTRTGFGDLDLTAPSDLAALRGAVGAARRWLAERPGRAHGYAIRELVAEVGRAYQRATGTPPGISSSETTAGPGYATPFEEVLMTSLAEAGTPLTLEAARSLYRSELRGKPKKPKTKALALP
jgi:hypothetical protein